MVEGACERIIASGLCKLDKFLDSSKVFGKLSKLQGPQNIIEHSIYYKQCSM